MAPTISLMGPLLVFTYVVAAIGFYRHIFKSAPVMEESTFDCQVIELFPQQEEIRRAA
jgi:hypothetical protein